MMLILLILLAQDSDSTHYGGFVEPDFPFITTAVVADSASAHAPVYNWTVRGIAIQLGDGTYACFDPDLLRMAVAWKGDYLSLATMAQVSYHKIDKGNGNPVVLGEVIAATGMYPGWMGENRQFNDPRMPGPNPGDPGKGPLPAELGRWKGLYVQGKDVVLSYEVRGTSVLERPGRILRDGEVGIVRTIHVGPTDEPLSLLVGEFPGRYAEESVGFLQFPLGRDSVVAIAVDGTSGGIDVDRAGHAAFHLPQSGLERDFRVLIWTGPRSKLSSFTTMRNEPVSPVGNDASSPARWPTSIVTEVQTSRDTTAFVFDHIELPLRNPWRRNVRPADLAFFSDGRAAVITFDGDVWIVSGLEGIRPEWRRFASGLYEPLAVEIVADQVYAYGREGIVRLHDLNGNGEADFYEAFAPGIIQSTMSREWPFDLVARPDGGFFVSMGGALQAERTRHTSPYMPGFQRGSAHNGSVLSVSSDGREVSVYADGFRGPYLGIHPGGALTASDQQGNFVPSTPIYAVERGAYYGVPATAHLATPLPDPRPPLTWIPHQVDPSSTSQVWITSDRMGPLSGRMVHLSYGRSRVFRVYVDSSATPVQGAVSPLPDNEESPTLKAAVHPRDGLLYLTGFQIWGSNARKLESMRRMRFTGMPTILPDEIRAGEQGIVLRFDRDLATPEATDFRVRRWNYLRTEAYGSGHFRLDGEPGEEELTVAAVHLSEDRRSLLIVLPDMKKVMQMAVDYRLRDAGGDAFSHSAYLSVNDARPIDLASFGLQDVGWRESAAIVESVATVVQPLPATPANPPSAVKGRHLYEEVGCAACHSLDGTQAGKLGPTFKGLFGSIRTLEGGGQNVADETYIRRAVLQPGLEVAEGFDQEMPSFMGILGAEDVESIVLFIKSLSETNE